MPETDGEACTRRARQALHRGPVEAGGAGGLMTSHDET